MANKKRIEKARIKFAKQEPALYKTCQFLCSKMAQYIVKTGATEVIVGIKNGQYYENAIN